MFSQCCHIIHNHIDIAIYGEFRCSFHVENMFMYNIDKRSPLLRNTEYNPLCIIQAKSCYMTSTPVLTAPVETYQLQT